MPSLPPSERRRARIRDVLLERTPEIQHLGRAIGYRLTAADPESGLVYLRELRDLCDQVLAQLGPRRAKRKR